MMWTLVDSNVLLDILGEDEEWLDWSAAMLAECADEGRLVINPIIYAELAVGFTSVEELDAALPTQWITREHLPWAAAFLAGTAYVRYRRAGGERRSPLADFYIGAHAAVSGYALLTRDAKRYSHYFPTLRIITP